MTAIIVIFPKGECSDVQPDTSAIAWVKRLLTSAAILHLNFGGDLGGLGTVLGEALPIGNALCSDSSMGSEGILIPR